MKLAADITDHVGEHYPPELAPLALELLDSINQKAINVGKTQLIRAILIIANGDINLIRGIIGSGFSGDPRNVIMKGTKHGLKNSGLSPL